MKILLGAIYPYAFFLLYLLIPFDNYIRALPNILLGILIVAFPIIVSKKDFAKLKSTPAILFFGFFVYLIINAALFGRLETDLNIIKKVLIAVGLLILYIPVHDVGKMKRAIVLSSLAAIVFSIVNIIILNDGSSDLIIENYQDLIEMLLIDRLYLGLLGVLSILISYESLRPKFHPENKYYLINILINVLFLLLIMSKVALLALLLLVIIRQFYGKNIKIRILVTVVFISLLAIIFISIQDDLKKQEFLSEQSDSETGFIKESLTWDRRTVVWHCANIVSQEVGLSFKGLGFKGSKDKLVACYDQKIEDVEKSNKFVNQRFNSHNQFVDFYLSTGVLGLLLLVSSLVFLFIRGRVNFIRTAFLLVLISYCLIENVFHRQLGAYFVGFILIILILQNEKIKQFN